MSTQPRRFSGILCWLAGLFAMVSRNSFPVNSSASGLASFFGAKGPSVEQNECVLSVQYQFGLAIHV